jgi:hypothetical protein
MIQTSLTQKCFITISKPLHQTLYCLIVRPGITKEDFEDNDIILDVTYNGDIHSSNEEFEIVPSQVHQILLKKEFIQEDLQGNAIVLMVDPRPSLYYHQYLRMWLES